VSALYPVIVDQLEDGHALVLGTTGSGKTYQLRGMLEQLRRADRRVGAVDKLGNHWGLTLDSDGASPGLDFVIFGGKRAAVPMTPDQGEQLGRLFVERAIPAIFDVSQWHADEQQRWVAAFADAVFRHANGALHLTLDEAQSWVPQGGGGGAFRAVQRLAEQGRGSGIRLLMSCQRLSRLDATVRGMVHTVVAMRQPGVLDRKAVRELIASSAADGELLDRELPKLPTGAGFLWSADQAELTRVDFPANATFDSSRTPRHGDAPPAPIAVSSALVDELRAALAVPRHPADAIPADPAAAYARGSEVGEALFAREQRIAALEVELATVGAEAERLADVDRECDDLNALVTAFEAAIAAHRAGRPLPKMHSGDADPQAAPRSAPGDPTTTTGGGDELDRSAERASDTNTAPPPSAIRDSAAGGGASDQALRRGGRALKPLARIHPAGLTEAQWATLAHLTRTGGTWGTYRGALRGAGLVEQRGDLWYATAAGVAVAGVAPMQLPPPGPERAKLWGGAIPGVRRMVDVLVKRWPHWTTREGLAGDLGMAATGGTFGTYLGRLRTNGLLEENGKRVRLAPSVMGESR
jgi:hypothetical protein